MADRHKAVVPLGQLAREEGGLEDAPCRRGTKGRAHASWVLWSEGERPLQLSARKGQVLLVRRDARLVWDFRSDVLSGVTGLHLEGAGPANGVFTEMPISASAAPHLGGLHPPPGGERQP